MKLPFAQQQPIMGTVTDEAGLPEILWQYTNANLYSQKVSGVTKMSNGNILITEGDFGVWEVTREGDLAWQFKGEGFFWRIYPYVRINPSLAPFNL